MIHEDGIHDESMSSMPMAVPGRRAVLCSLRQPNACCAADRGINTRRHHVDGATGSDASLTLPRCDHDRTASANAERRGSSRFCHNP